MQYLKILDIRIYYHYYYYYYHCCCYALVFILYVFCQFIDL